MSEKVCVGFYMTIEYRAANSDIVFKAEKSGNSYDVLESVMRKEVKHILEAHLPGVSVWQATAGSEIYDDNLFQHCENTFRHNGFYLHNSIHPCYL